MSTRIQNPIEIQLTGEPRGYAIVIQAGLLSRIGEECRKILSATARLLVITDTNLANRHAPALLEPLHAAGFQTELYVIPAGECSKSLDEAEKIYRTAMQAGMSRKDAFIAFGGGVVGDLAGFCASTYHRGAPVVQIPTTLVAQVDSAIGGKTAVNFGSVKNIVGTFHQPAAVLIDPLLLDTLPERELTAGLSEVAKYGLIETSCTGESGLFDWLLSHSENVKPVFEEMVRRCCAIKASVVMEDERETKGLRYFLNLGHTFGHAYESLSNYRLLHGEAVAIGMVKAAALSVRLGLLDSAEAEREALLLRNFGLLPGIRQAASFAPQALLDCMRKDKKNDDGRIRLILPEGKPGHVVVRDDIADSEILAVLGETGSSR